MEIFLIISIICVVVLSAQSAAWLAKDLGKSTRVWFWISFFIPVLSCLILLCIPEKPKAVENDDLYDHMY